MERIFITGLGFATCLGNDRETFWKNLTAGVCGLDTLKLHDTTDLLVNIGGEVLDLNKDRINVNDLVATKKMDRASRLPCTRRTRPSKMRGCPPVTSVTGSRS